ncbi:DNA polymerase IV [Sulfurimonas lithotrophica]|uniref:DNA polymerase IV n=1 Tax=Sulfurimonas lithotrophica TaxID=2590022 RepID=A0A5P8P3F4_9BACT|nr:DNA polymerase IV [Sulfurimonas lithotrophica]QFR50127.1 DNA polymerase IV [Sulfurimonas lithotrophica]
MKIHIDIDCFFVSAIRTIDVSLEHKAVAIGGRSDTKIFDTDAKNQSVNLQNSGSFVPTFFKAYETKDDDLDAFRDSDGKIRGILTTSSYEARAFGVKTAMRIEDALRLCPHLIIKAPNMSLYQKLSHELHEFLQERIPLIEQASIDEFYGDLKGWIEDEDVEAFIDNLRHEIKKELKLPVSIGAAKTRYIAKMATSYAKPFGCKLINEYNFDEFINPIKVQDFAGIGRSMSKRLASAQIFTLGELRKRRGTLESWGPYAKELYKRVDGISDAQIQTKHERKSIGISRTIEPIYDRAELRRRIHILARHLNFAIGKLGVIPTVYHLGIRYEMNQKSHKNISLCERFTEKKFDSLCISLFNEADIHKRLCVIRLSINCSGFTHHSKRELSLINFAEDEKMESLTKHNQKLREKYGLDMLKWGSEL